jgi:hypothetical protein
MTIKTLSALAILSVAFSSPVLARAASVKARSYHERADHLRQFRGTYDQAPLSGPYDTGVPALRGGTGEGSQYDRSFPGGFDPDLRPSGS